MLNMAQRSRLLRLVRAQLVACWLDELASSSEAVDEADRNDFLAAWLPLTGVEEPDALGDDILVKQ